MPPQSEILSVRSTSAVEIPTLSKLSCVTGKPGGENIVFSSIIQNDSDWKVITQGNQCWEIAREINGEKFFMASRFCLVLGGLPATDKTPQCIINRVFAYL